MLIEEIANQIPDKKYLSVYAHVVYENEGYEPIARTEEKQRELFETQYQLNKTIFDAGLCRMFYSLPRQIVNNSQRISSKSFGKRRQKMIQKICTSRSNWAVRKSKHNVEIAVRNANK